MSSKHPIVAVTGSSGSGTTVIRDAFAHIFEREGLKAQFVDGNSFRRFDAEGMMRAFEETLAQGDPINHFGPRANLFDRLEGLFREYSRSGTGLMRRYLENPNEAAALGQARGTFTDWKEIPGGTDLLFYKGLHGGCIESTWSRRRMTEPHNPMVIRKRIEAQQSQDQGVDIAQWVDLLIGVVPVMNLEWIQKIHRDVNLKGCKRERVVETILRYMPDYVRYITPQFSLTDINFQRVPLVDTSNPFIAREVPSASESMLVIRFREPERFDLPHYIRMFENSFMSRRNTLVVPGGSLQIALEVICAPLVHQLVERKRAAG